ncbi:MAG: Alpha/beta hydrolase family protein [Ferruginibacter sp.]|nr:Alpha/beta hydrolase family protein [Ferruginibacter sp.]
MKNLMVLLGFLSAATCTRAQQLNGTWEGNISVKEQLIPIIFHLKTDSKIYKASFDSPSQKAFNIPCSGVETRNDSIIISMASINGSYAGKISADEQSMEGTWKQGNAALPLNIRKTSDQANMLTAKRPQTPKPPFPYTSENIEYSNADHTIRFGATITVPPVNKPGEKFPAILLITGSGQQDRDENIMEHKPFAILADEFTKKGMIVLRVDDRGMGKTTGSFNKSTSADFANDVEAGINYLKTRTDVNLQKIGLLGHSEGGMIAPMVAARRNDIDFIILLAGPGIPINNLMTEQYAAVAAGQTSSKLLVKAASDLYHTITTTVINNPDSAEIYQRALLATEAWADTTPKTILSALQLTDKPARAKYVASMLQTFMAPWFRYFLAYDPQANLRKLQSKVLALNGSRDIQVLATSNLAGIKAALEKSKSPAYEVHEMAGMNHLFQTCKKCTVTEYGELEESFSPEALALISTWLTKNVL